MTMTMRAMVPLGPMVASARSESWLRLRSLANLTRMGHCAPTVMRTLLDASAVQAPELVKLAAGLPGGIGNTGEECGGVTAPLMCLGLRHARDPLHDGLPPIIYMGHELVRRFAACHGTIRCSEIRGPSGVPWRCIGVVARAPGRWQATLARDCTDAVGGERREAYRVLHRHLAENRFHCARAVVQDLGDQLAVDDALLDACAGFVGGTVFCGLTCSALSAGIVAMGAARGELEDSRPRVMRMIGLMAVGGDAFADGINAFNRLMNMGNQLAQWFSARFGATRCAPLTGCDFSTEDGVRRYVESGQVSRCREIARAVAKQVGCVIAASPTTAAVGGA